MTSLDVVREFYARFGSNNLDGALALLAKDVKWFLQGPRQIPYAGAYSGREAVASFFATLLAVEDIRHFAPKRFYDAQGVVLVEGEERAVAKPTGKAFESNWIHIFEVENGAIIAWREYIDTHALATAYTP